MTSLAARCTAVLLALGLLAACKSEPPREQFPEIGFGHLSPIVLRAARLEIERNYRPSGSAPQVEVPRPPLDAIERWAHERLRTTGQGGVARLTVTDASVVEVALAVGQGLSYSFTTQQAKRYDAHLAVRLDILDPHGFSQGQVTAEASNSRSIPQKATGREIDEAEFLVVQGAMLDLNAELERNIRQYLTRFVQP